ncbi:hypothetical protein [Vibrio nitrifigilis]|uniref:Lipoprotein n=1 Tax=Vibrio nitrifigilis TaxID=2789781 RepID=A0ABS0GJ58_9VIBR|nr:hypothetical protein [Vibrio nitrifigilis]MBF9002484.1 hypothetical protein [Vibrio nitrifigilis]
MAKIINVIAIVILLLFGNACFSKDHVDSKIIINFDKEKYRDVTQVNNISPNTLIKLWGWLRLIPDGKITSQKYFLEWEFESDDKNENLGNYRTNRKYLQYQRPIDREEAFYWVSKRIWSQDKGRYIFRVYIQEDGKHKIVSESSVEIEG